MPKPDERDGLPRKGGSRVVEPGNVEKKKDAPKKKGAAEGDEGGDS